MDLYVDASGIGVGACLMQKQNDEYKAIAYSSMAFSPTEQRYSTTERELLAIRFGVKNFLGPPPSAQEMKSAYNHLRWKIDYEIFFFIIQPPYNFHWC